MVPRVSAMRKPGLVTDVRDSEVCYPQCLLATNASSMARSLKLSHVDHGWYLEG